MWNGESCDYDFLETTNGVMHGSPLNRYDHSIRTFGSKGFGVRPETVVRICDQVRDGYVIRWYGDTG